MSAVRHGREAPGLRLLETQRSPKNEKGHKVENGKHEGTYVFGSDLALAPLLKGCTLTQLASRVAPMTLERPVHGLPTHDSDSDLIADTQRLLPPTDVHVGFGQPTNLQEQVFRRRPAPII